VARVSVTPEGAKKFASTQNQIVCHPERSGSRHFVSHAVEEPVLSLSKEPAVALALAVACSPYPNQRTNPKNPNQRTVISTEAAHSLIVSSVVEKSAFLPRPCGSPLSALTVAFAFLVVIPERDQLLPLLSPPGNPRL
jgi:hypothetical protein